MCFLKHKTYMRETYNIRKVEGGGGNARNRKDQPLVLNLDSATPLAKNGEKQLKHSNFKTYHGFHGNIFKVSVGKTPKTAKTCSKRKTNDLFAFYCNFIKSQKQLHLIFFHR